MYVNIINLIIVFLINTKQVIYKVQSLELINLEYPENCNSTSYYDTTVSICKNCPVNSKPLNS